MSVEAWKLAIDIGQWIITLLIGLYVWQSNRHRITRESIERVNERTDQRLDNHSVRITAVEQDIKHLPDTPTIAKIDKELTGLAGDLKAVMAKVDGIEKLSDLVQTQVNRMDEFLKRTS